MRKNRCLTGEWNGKGKTRRIAVAVLAGRLIIARMQNMLSVRVQSERVCMITAAKKDCTAQNYEKYHAYDALE